MTAEIARVAIWPDGTWCALDERADFEDMLLWKSDDYAIVEVAEWVEDGSPADHYFAALGCKGPSAW